MDKNIEADMLKKVKSHVLEKNYDAALKIINDMDINRIKNAPVLCLVGEVLMVAKEYDRAEIVFLKAYDKSPSNRRIVKLLTSLYIEKQDYAEAEYYYKEFISTAPRDLNRYILRYRIDRGKGERLSVLINTLERLKDYEYIEEWAYELATLYERDGNKNKCLRECDEIVLWFGHGEFVDKAIALKCQLTGEPLPKVTTVEIQRAKEEAERKEREEAERQRREAEEKRLKEEEERKAKDEAERQAKEEEERKLREEEELKAKEEAELKAKEEEEQRIQAEMLKAFELESANQVIYPDQEGVSKIKEALDPLIDKGIEDGLDMDLDIVDQDSYIEEETIVESEEVLEEVEESEEVIIEEKPSYASSFDTSIIADIIKKTQEVGQKESTLENIELLEENVEDVVKEVVIEEVEVKNVGVPEVIETSISEDGLTIYPEELEDDEIIEENEMIEEFLLDEEEEFDEFIEDVEEIELIEDFEEIEEELIEEVEEIEEEELIEEVEEIEEEELIEEVEEIEEEELIEEVEEIEEEELVEEVEEIEEEELVEEVEEIEEEELIEEVEEIEEDEFIEDDELLEDESFFGEDELIEEEFNDFSWIDDKEEDIEEPIIEEDVIEDDIFEAIELESEELTLEDSFEDLFDLDLELDDDYIEDDMEEFLVAPEALVEEDEDAYDEIIEDSLYDLDQQMESWEDRKFIEELFSKEDPILKAIQEGEGSDSVNLSTMRDIFATIPNLADVKQQLAETVTKLETSAIENFDLLAPYDINFVVLSSDNAVKSQIAIGLAKVLNTYGICDKRKIVRSNAKELNNIDFSMIFEKINGGCLIIENAHELSEKSVAVLQQEVAKESQDVAIVLESQEDNIKELWLRYPQLRAEFLNVINVSNYNEMELVTLAKGYIEKRQYELSKEAALMLRDYFSKEISKNRVIGYEDVMHIVDRGIINLDERNVKNLFMTVLDNKYEEAQMTRLLPEDFDNIL